MVKESLINKNKTRKGFTLVELSIVLVIIGLIIGGVLVGQELIAQAEISNLASSITKYETAVNTFKAKYRQYPGDITKADVYGLCNAPTCDDNDGRTGTPDNGNGDGILQDDGSTDTGNLTTTELSGELTNFWVNLTNAGMIGGSVDAQTDGSAAAVETNYPATPIGTGLIIVTANDNSWYWMTGVDATIATATGLQTLGDSLTGEQAFGIDSKLDDSMPLTGIVTAISAFSATGAITLESNGTPAATDCIHTGDEYPLASEPDTELCTVLIRASK